MSAMRRRGLILGHNSPYQLVGSKLGSTIPISRQMIKGWAGSKQCGAAHLPFETDDNWEAAAQTAARRQQQARAAILAAPSGMVVGEAQQQPLLKLLRELDQPATEVLLIELTREDLEQGLRRYPVVADTPMTYFDGSQTLLLSISRTDLTDFAKHLLLPSDQNFLVEKNLETLAPVIEGKRGRGDTTMRTDPRTGRTSAP